MIRIPQHIDQLKGYKPGKPIADIISELGLSEVAVLWNNENNLGPSPLAIKEANAALAGSHLYPDPVSLQLRDLIAQHVGRTVDEVIVGNGSEEILNNVLKSFCEGDDELLTSEGTFVAVYIWAKSNNVPCVKAPLTKDYRFDLAAIEQAIGPKTKVIYLSNPNNPTGAMITREELEGFLEKVPDHILVVIDEAYFEFAEVLSADYYDSTQIQKKNIITLRTFSKAHGIAAIRIGYGIADASIIEPLSKVKMTFAPSNVAQAAGCGAVQDVDFLNRIVKNNKEGIKFLYQAFDEMELSYVPSFGNFVMIDFGTAEKVQEVFQALMKEGVFVRPLTAFGLPHCIRITVGLPEENKLCVEKLKKVLS